ncbi:MAG: hypothetical protein JXA38_02475, partial [Methanosarcinaceae archaeon]|nr:hypothetical protein [Methanosarcinaceae archaeon]
MEKIVLGGVSVKTKNMFLIIGILIALMGIATSYTANNTDIVEIRGPVYNGPDLAAIIGNVDTDFIEMNALNFSGFYYDIDDSLTTESLKIYGGYYVNGRTIEKDGLVYTTTIKKVEYNSLNIPGTYNIIGFFGEKYVPLKENTPNKLAKLLVDNDDKYAIRNGTSMELTNGYALSVKQVEGNKARIEFSKDGEYLKDKLIDVSGTDGIIWEYNRNDVANEDDVLVFIVNITDVFDGETDHLILVKGMWLIDFEDVLEINSGDQFGKLDVNIGSNSLTFTNEDSAITLTKDSEQQIAEGLSFNVADDDNVRFYLMKEYTELGTYEIRGTVYEDVAGYWDASSFSGFIYDMNENIATEELTILSLNDRTIEEDDLVYTTTIQKVEYSSPNIEGQYNILGLFAEKYVPLKDNTPDKLAKLLVDSDENFVLNTGQPLELLNGYALEAKEIDIDGNSVVLELSKDGVYIEDEVIDISSNPDGVTWVYDKDVGNEDDVVVFIANITDVNRSENITVIDGMWLIDFEDVLEINSSDQFGQLEVNSIDSNSLSFTNDESFTLTRDSEQEIAEGLSFKVADNDTLRYYLYVEKTIEEAATYTVGPNLEDDYTSIQAAINDVSVLPGDTIIVNSGTYNENVVLNKSLYLIGEGQPVIDGGGVSCGIEVNASESTIDGFTITNTECGIALYSSDNYICNNTVNNNVYSVGIWVTTNNNVIYYNTINPNPESAFGIILTQNVNNNSISGNTVNGFYPFYLSTGANNNGFYNTTIGSNSSIWLINESYSNVFDNTT